MRKPKIVPAEVWRVPQSHLQGALPDQPGARPAPDYCSVARSVALAMRSLPLWIQDPAIETLSEKYAKLLYKQIGAAAPMTAQQARAHLAEIRKCAEALAKALTRAGPDIEVQLDASRATSLDRIGIKTPSVGATKIAIQWIAEAAVLAEPAPAKRKGPQRKDFAREVSRLAAVDYYRLTGVKPTATMRIKGDGFLGFLKKILKAMESPNADGSASKADEIRYASPESLAADAVKWCKRP